MDFHLSEAEQMLQTTARDFAKNEIEPVAAAVDEANVFAMANFKKLAEVGFTGLAIPPEYDGSGGDVMELVLVMEELAKACASTCDIVDAHISLCARPILLYGNEEQKKKYLPPLCRGEKVGARHPRPCTAGNDSFHRGGRHARIQP